MPPASSTLVIPTAPSVPQHIAIIMDGNGRWAKARHLPRLAGHTKGVDAVRTTITRCNDIGVKYLTLFAFSSENWRRPKTEVTFLMRLFRTVLRREVHSMKRNNVRLHVVGDLSVFDDELIAIIRESESITESCSGLVLTVCANYGGRWDILQAMQKAASAGKFSDSVREEDFTPYLSMAHAPEPDLMIRTGGEQRISNFLLWQLAYTELYFTDLYWPDFDEKALQAAIDSYQQRERRFGQTSEQTTPLLATGN
ncbi:MAG: polyprenyl diphosphate synthase [Burkholderiaceae bacterium]